VEPEHGHVLFFPPVSVKLIQQTRLVSHVGGVYDGLAIRLLLTLVKIASLGWYFAADDRDGGHPGQVRLCSILLPV
jgi:hypothetical protein